MKAEVAEPIRVFVADNEAAIRDAISDLVGLEPDMEVVAVALDGEDAIALAQQLQPEVALLDVRMAAGGGQAAAQIAIVSPTTRIVALSAYDDRGSVLDMLRQGAVGFLVKGAPPTEILEAI